MLNLLQNLFQNEIISNIIKNDGLIYGNFVRDIITNKFNKKRMYNVNAFAPIIFKKIIERDLFEYTKNINDYSNLLKSSYDVVEYEMVRTNIYNIKNITITYMSDIYFSDKEGYLKNADKHIMLDVNSIGIGRKGIKLLHNSSESIPNPFSSMLENIKLKKFKILYNITNEKQLYYLLNYLDNGWTYDNRMITEFKGKDFENEKCTICIEMFKSNDIIYLLKDCNHYYHKDCWEKYLIQTIKSNKSTSNIFDKSITISCPTCRNKYNLNNVI